MPSAIRLALIAALAAVALPATAADVPSLLGASRDWTAYWADTASGKVCYAVGTPIEMLPKAAARGGVYFIVSTWPDRRISDELQIVPGYEYKSGVPAAAEIGAVKAEFFTQNEGKEGSAWVREQADEAALVRAMRAGTTLTVTGTSKRGTKTTDTYSLSGIATALDRAHTACGK